MSEVAEMPEDAAREDPGAAPSEEAEAARGEAQEAVRDEAEILRRELALARDALADALSEIEELKDRALRARSDLENLRRRAGGDVERAHEAGLDSALLPVLIVYDDLGRALLAAETGDPASIVRGVQAVRDTIERELAALGVQRVGSAGEPFDPDRHEALTTVPVAGDAEPGTIADVFEAGFVRNDRLVRPARVVVYQQE